jgi:hypothetical protein
LIAVTSLRCGVCSSGGAGGGLAQLKSQFPGLGKIPSCGTGSGEEEQPLVLECPRDFQAGCLTQTKGKFVIISIFIMTLSTLLWVTMQSIINFWLQYSILRILKQLDLLCISKKKSIFSYSGK